MSVRTKNNPLAKLRHQQPFLGFSSKIRIVRAPESGHKRAPRILVLDSGASCREELVWNAREFIQDLCANWKHKTGSWKSVAEVRANFEIDHPSLKQPGATCIWLNEIDPEDYYDGDPVLAPCSRECCTGDNIEIVDALAGPIAVLLNPDRYVGNWWVTEPQEHIVKTERRWYGADNFFLRHPALLSLMLGVFRQAMLIHRQGLGEDIKRAVSRKEVEDCLTNADPVLAMRLATKLRPWLEAPARLGVHHFSFPRGGWHRLSQLHKAIYKYGYDTLFEGDLQHSWGLAKTGQDQFDDRHSIVNGPNQYWGNPKHKGTPAGQLLAKLGK